MLKKVKLFKKPLFQKRRWSCDFPSRKTPFAQKHRAISRQEKMAFSTPVGLSWDSPPPPTESVRTDGNVTIRSQPKFLGLIGYQISLAMELRWRALPAGSAKNWAFH